MDKDTYNIFSKLRANIEDFENNGIYVVGKPSAKDKFDVENRGKDGGYYFNQRRTLEAIDLACASKYKRGIVDSEGQRKTYLNIVNFHADVSINQIGINVVNYIMMPTNDDYSWPVFFIDKKFKEWADENSYNDIIDELTDDYARKGTCVVKRTNKTVERVPLRTIKNTQSAKSLEYAAKNGGYAILENEMAYPEMQKYPKWRIDDLDQTKTYNVFERYALVPKGLLLEFKSEGSSTPKDWAKMILTQQILIPHATFMQGKSAEKNDKGVIAYMEQITGKFPLEEAHYKKRDGIWLGEGEVEKQLENQLARNLTANLRRRSLMWAARRIFQSTDDEVARNLLMEVKDGDVLQIKNNGNVTPVNTQTMHNADFAADEQSWSENSQDISFSYDVASGDNMPSGTPFRLGAIMEAAVSKYFKRKQDTLSEFLKRSFFDQLLPIFKEEMYEEHSIRYEVTDAQYELALQAMVQLHANDILKREWYNGNFISSDQAKALVEVEIRKKKYLFWDIPQGFYEEANCYMRLNLNEPIAGDLETLTSLYSSMVQNQDPRAEEVLQQIFQLKGMNLQALIGTKAPTPQPAAPATPANGQKPGAPTAPLAVSPAVAPAEAPAQ